MPKMTLTILVRGASAAGGLGDGTSVDRGLVCDHAGQDGRVFEILDFYVLSCGAGRRRGGPGDIFFIRQTAAMTTLCPL
jgi:hypothetical protein